MERKNKFKKVLEEYEHGRLYTHGRQVKSYKQAVAIAFNEARTHARRAMRLRR